MAADASAVNAAAPPAVESPGRRRAKQAGKYLAMRLAVFAVTLWGAYTLSFLFFRLMPGDPVQAFIANLATMGEVIDPAAAKEQMRLVNETLGRNGNLAEQYVRYFSRVLRGDFGASFLNFPNPSINLVLRALPYTGILLFVSVLLAWSFGLLIGAIVGWQRQRPWAQTLAAFAIALGQVPYYFLALFLLIVLAYGMGLFPIRGAFGADVSPGFNIEFIGSYLRHALLPAASLVTINTCHWMISTRALMISVLGEDYLLYAQAEGLSARRILYGYALRNALLPQVTHLAISLGFVINGAILLEQLFVYPGVGLLLITAIRELDVNTAQAIVLMSITAVLTANLIVDLILPFIDPRVQARV